MIIVATMILRYHYFADVCASVLIGIFAFYAPYRFGYKLDHSSPEYIELESTDTNIYSNQVSISNDSTLSIGRLNGCINN